MQRSWGVAEPVLFKQGRGRKCHDGIWLEVGPALEAWIQSFRMCGDTGAAEGASEVTRRCLG